MTSRRSISQKEKMKIDNCPTRCGSTWRRLGAVAIALLLCALPSVAGAQDDEKKLKQFGTYQERTLDLEVKVQNGTVRIWRVWEGDLRRWSINPQHDAIEESDEKETDEYGQLVAKEMRRGLRSFPRVNGGMFRSSRGGGSGSGGGGQSQSASLGSVAAFLRQVDAQFCTVSDVGGEQIVINSEGRKWVNVGTRHWAQFSVTGALLSWGIGNDLIGRALYDGPNLRGYADVHGQEVITYTYNQFRELRFIEDLRGNKVEYKYNVTGQIEEVIDPVGRRTRYEYDGSGNIIRKIVGDQNAAGADANNPHGEQVSHTLAYFPNGQLRSMRDQNGEGSEYTYLYTPSTKIFTKTENASGNIRTVTTTHLEDGLVGVSVNGSNELRVIQLCEDSVIIDRHNRITYFDRDRIGRLHRITFPNGKEVKFEHTLANWPEQDKPWDSEGKEWGVKAFTNAVGTRYEYIRSRRGEILEAKETTRTGKVRTWRFGYDGFGNQTSYRVLVREQLVPDDLEDFHGKWVYDDFGNPIQFIDAQLNTWSFAYDARGNVTEITEPEFSSKWIFEHTPNGEITYAKDPAGFEQFFVYNSRGLLKEYREVYASGEAAVWRYSYSARGKVTRIVDPFEAEWTFEYDGAARLIAAVDPDGHTQRWTYDGIGRVKTAVDGNGVSISYDYFDTALPGAPEQPDNAFGPITRINYPTFSEELHYDLRQRLVARVLRPQTGEPLAFRFAYDEEGRPTEVERPDGQKATFAYDGHGRLISETLPGWGTSTTEYAKQGREVRYRHPNGSETLQHFNTLGQLVLEERADGQTSVRYEYDRVGNLQRFFNSNDNLHRFIYGPGDRLLRLEVLTAADDPSPREAVDLSYNLRGDLLGYSDAETSTAFAVDKIGRVLSASTDYGPFEKGHAYTYRANGLPASFTDPTGLTYQYLWDPADQLQGVVIPGEGSITYSYNPTDWVQPQRITLPGGVTQDYTYDDLRRIERIHSKAPGGATIQDFQYSYLPTDLIESIETEYGAIRYGYDDGQRLTSVEHPTLPPEAYVYDEFGNRSPASGSPWSYDANGALLSDGEATYEYDAQGNRVRKITASGTTHYFYDEGDSLVRVEEPLGSVVAEYGYDASGVRLWKEVAGERTYFHYSSEGLVAELDAAGEPLRTYAYEPGSEWSTSPLLLRDNGGSKFFHHDHLGTPHKLTSPGGAIAWSAQYTGFGAAHVGPGSATNPLRLPGQYFDPESGLHQNLMRDYDPGIGAYLTQDPYGLLTGPNRYAYAYGDPVHLYDPTGEAVPVIVVVAIAVKTGYDVVTTGFEALECADWLFNWCLYEGRVDSCWTVLINAGLRVTKLDIVRGAKNIPVPWHWAAKPIGSNTVPNVTRSSSQRLKTTIRNLSRHESSGLSQQKIDQLRRIAERAGARVRIDRDGVKGMGVRPHAHVEGLGKKVQSRHIWIRDGVR